MATTPATAPPLAIEAVDALDREAFVARFGGVFEDAPDLAAAAWEHRPFGDRAGLLAAFDAAADQLGPDRVLALLRAHPVLGATGPMAPASVAEQAGAGLVDLAQARRDRIAADNARYLDRFGFPFILAVRGLDADDIAAALTSRLDNPAEVEAATALAQVRRIAALRIEQLVAP